MRVPRFDAHAVLPRRRRFASLSPSLSRSLSFFLYLSPITPCAAFPTVHSLFTPNLSLPHFPILHSLFFHFHHDTCPQHLSIPPISPHQLLSNSPSTLLSSRSCPSLRQSTQQSTTHAGPSFSPLSIIDQMVTSTFRFTFF